MDLTHKHWRETMAVVALIPSVEEFLLAGLISLAIGFSPLFIISLLSVLSIYGCVVVVQCCAWCQHVGHDEECGTTEEVVPNSRFKSSFFLDWRWDKRYLRFYEGRGGAIKPSGDGKWGL